MRTLTEQSSSEVEFISLSKCVRDVAYFHVTLSEMGVVAKEPIMVHEDKLGAIQTSTPHNIFSHSKEPLKVEASEGALRKRNKPVKVSKIEEDLYVWVMGHFNVNRAINGEMISTTAAGILTTANTKFPPADHGQIKFPPGG